MPEDTTLAELKALVAVPGALKIITSEIDKKAGKNPDLTRPSSFVLHDVVSLEGPDPRGRYVAYSKEGDWTSGYPGALLSRLRQWRNG